MQCVECGDPLSGRQKRYCSRKCSSKFEGRVRVAQGRIRESRQRGKVTNQAYARLRYRPGPGRPEAMCAVCGAPTGKAVRNDRSQVCSDTCRAKMRAPRPRRPKQPKPPRPTWQRMCARCDASFETDRAHQRHCSKRCGQKAARERRKIAERQSGSVIGRVDRAAVFKRDGYICWLCEYPTNPDVDVPDLEAPTVDHVIPLARGGAHTMDNVRTAHFICNAYKRDLAM